MFVYTRPFGPVKLSGTISSAATQQRFFADATVVAHDPARYALTVLNSGGGDPSAWLQQTLTTQLKQVVDIMAASTALEQLQADSQAISQSVATNAAAVLGQMGVTFQQLSKFGIVGGAGGAADASTSKLELVGPIAGKVATTSPDENVNKWEKFGLFVAADPVAMRHYSGAEPGWRWLARGAGSLLHQSDRWPMAPNGSTQYHFSSEQEARAYYGALRQHAMSVAPGLVAQDTRASFNLNAPSAYAETLWQNDQDVLYLIYDRMEDMEALAQESDGIGIHPAGPDTPHAQALPLLTYKSKSDVHYVAVCRGESGAADHVILVYSDKHAPEPTIPEGLPRAEWMSKYDRAALPFDGDILVVQWGRFSGADILADEGEDPVASLSAKLGDKIAIPLQTNHEAATRLGDVPPAYAIRMAPGAYSLHYYELTTQQHGNFFAAAISRDGAESFLPTDVVGNAGGISFCGLSVEQYAMLSVERDNIVMRLGIGAGPSQEMAALCAKYNIHNSANGMAARLNEWEHYIQGDAAFSAQWAMQLGIATMRLQGQEPTKENMAAMAAQQNMAQQSLEAGVATADAIRDAAIQVIQNASNRAPEEVIQMVGQMFPQFTPEDILYKTVRILRDPDDFGRFNNVETCTEPLCRAHFQTKPPEDQKFEGSEESYFKEQREAIYSAYDIEVPGGFFSKLFS
jgi:hypothetical protein